MLAKCLLYFLVLAATPPPFAIYQAHPATVVRVVDGDTVVFLVALEYDVSITVSIRMERFNAPEMTGPNPVMATAARDRLAAYLVGRRTWVVRSGPRTFARYVGRVYTELPTGVVDLSEVMTAEGFHVPQGR